MTHGEAGTDAGTAVRKSASGDSAWSSPRVFELNLPGTVACILAVRPIKNRESIYTVLRIRRNFKPKKQKKQLFNDKKVL